MHSTMWVLQMSSTGLELKMQTFPQGQYVGEFRGGERHGMGRFEYSNGNRYVGSWDRGVCVCEWSAFVCVCVCVCACVFLPRLSHTKREGEREGHWQCVNAVSTNVKERLEGGAEREIWAMPNEVCHIHCHLRQERERGGTCDLTHPYID